MTNKFPYDELQYFKKIAACEGKTREWMANHYLISKGNDREDVMRLLRLHAGYQAFIAKDKSWEPLYYAFKKRNYAQIRSIAEGETGKPQTPNQDFSRCAPLKGQLNDRSQTTSNNSIKISYKEFEPDILKKTNFTAKLDFTVYAIGYKDTDNKDGWSKKFMGFKQNNPQDVIGGQRLLCLIVKFLIEEKNLGSNTGILTALSHNKESAVTTSHLYKTANFISNRCGIEFLLTSLTKKKHYPLKKQFHIGNRKKEIEGCYSCSRLENIENVIIMDDFTTTGLTIKEIARAIRETNHHVNLYGVVLAFHPASFKEGMNDRIPTLFGDLWTHQNDTH